MKDTMSKIADIERDMLHRFKSSCGPSLFHASDTSIARETSRRLGEELKANGKTSFTIGDLRRIQIDMFEGSEIESKT